MGLLVFYFFCGWPGAWVSCRVGVEIEVNANSTPNLVGVGAGAELGNNTRDLAINYLATSCHQQLLAMAISIVSGQIDMALKGSWSTQGIEGN